MLTQKEMKGPRMVSGVHSGGAVMISVKALVLGLRKALTLALFIYFPVVVSSVHGSAVSTHQRVWRLEIMQSFWGSVRTTALLVGVQHLVVIHEKQAHVK